MSASRLGSLQGLDRAKRVVSRLIAGATSPHAVLLYGPEGAGKTALARILAEAWLCSNPVAEGPCGACAACRAMASDQAVDFLAVEPTGPSSIIRVGSVNGSDKDSSHVGVRPFFRVGPLVGRHKIVLIQQADRMSDAASNALLKTLEEPFPYAKLILTTVSPTRLAPTIVSRCLAVACELPAGGVGTTEAERIFSEGSPGRAARIAAMRESYEALLELFEDLPSRSPRSALKSADEFRVRAAALESDRIGARAALAEALRAFAAWARAGAQRPEVVSEIVEAHRRVVGNGSGPLVIDALFARVAKELNGAGRA